MKEKQVLPAQQERVDRK
ncbi:hypothetical protein MIMGU_mgv1a0158821mg, partial [Erythranthe guttata]